MYETKFWKCIDQASSSGDFDNHLKKNLCDLGFDEIISFKNILLQKLVEAYIFPLLAANFVISSYVSDDGFKEFRAWLVSKGQQVFQNAINNPETIADWLDENEVDDIRGAEFLYIADEAYTELGGNEDNFYKKVQFPLEPNMNMAWPENKKEFQLQYPKLVAKFWNQQRIEDLHPD